MQYVKKPIPVEAIQLPLSQPTLHGYHEWSQSAPEWLHNHDIWVNEDGLTVPTLEGNMNCHWGDYIVQGVRGEIYPCRRDIFEETYELYT